MKVPLHGRGAVSNPAHRFESLDRQPVNDGWARDEEEAAPPDTQVIQQPARTALTRNDSPDIPFDRSVNPYQGCEHGCAVLTAPVIPGLTGPDLERVMEAARDAGAKTAGYVLLRLPHELKQVFQEWLDVHHPLKAGHVMSLVRQMREGRENNSEFGLRQRGTGVFADLLARRFTVARKRLGLDQGLPPLECGKFRPPGRGGQLGLF